MKPRTKTLLGDKRVWLVVRICDVVKVCVSVEVEKMVRKVKQKRKIMKVEGGMLFVTEERNVREL